MVDSGEVRPVYMGCNAVRTDEPASVESLSRRYKAGIERASATCKRWSSLMRGRKNMAGSRIYVKGAVRGSLDL